MATTRALFRSRANPENSPGVLAFLAADGVAVAGRQRGRRSVHIDSHGSLAHPPRRPADAAGRPLR